MLESTQNVTELKRITEAAAFFKAQLVCLRKGSRTFCKSIKIKCKLALKISEVRMLT